MTRTPNEKGKTTFQPINTTVLPSPKLPASLSLITVPRKLSPVKTDYIIPRFEIVGTEFMNAMCSGYQYDILANNCIDLEKACHLYFMSTDKLFAINCYYFNVYSYITYN